MFNKIFNYLLKYRLVLISVAILIMIIDLFFSYVILSNKINNLETEIKEIKMDYQFLKYNNEELEEYKDGKF